jgi:hypothetical protein
VKRAFEFLAAVVIVTCAVVVLAFVQEKEEPLDPNDRG